MTGTGNGIGLPAPISTRQTQQNKDEHIIRRACGGIKPSRAGKMVRNGPKRFEMVRIGPKWRRSCRTRAGGEVDKAQHVRSEDGAVRPREQRPADPFVAVLVERSVGLGSDVASPKLCTQKSNTPKNQNTKKKKKTTKLNALRPRIPHNYPTLDHAHPATPTTHAPPPTPAAHAPPPTPRHTWMLSSHQCET